MRLTRFGPEGAERTALVTADGKRIDCGEGAPRFDREFFGSPAGLARLRAWAETSSAKAPPVPTAARWAAPLEVPGKIVCIGLNYSDHARESGMALPAEPVVFMKANSACCGPYDDLVLPAGSTKVDWEVELAVVIGDRAKNVPIEIAMNHVFGYVLHNDYSERAWQLERGGQWVKGKSADGFAPLGPWILTKDEVPDPSALGLWLTVNGEKLQHSSTRNLVFGVPHLVSYVSQFMTLLPGDVISTGTPAGVGLGLKPPRYLKAGDVVALGADGLGEQRQTIRAG